MQKRHRTGFPGQCTERPTGIVPGLDSGSR